MLRHEFVDYIPDQIEEGTLYVSIPYATAVHKCCCGCGNEVVTPFTPTDWRLTFDGESISLQPSIGNWSFPCKSHYWVRQNRVEWAPKWSRRQIETGRQRDSARKAQYFKGGPAEPSFEAAQRSERPAALGFFGRLWRKLRRRSQV